MLKLLFSSERRQQSDLPNWMSISRETSGHLPRAAGTRVPGAGKGAPAWRGRGEPMAARHREDKDPRVPRRLVTSAVNAGLPLALGLAKRDQSRLEAERLPPPPPHGRPRGAEGVRPPAEAGPRDLLFTSSQLLGPLLPRRPSHQHKRRRRRPADLSVVRAGGGRLRGHADLCLRRLLPPRRSPLLRSARATGALSRLRFSPGGSRYCRAAQGPGPAAERLTQILRTGQNTWESKNILAVSFAPLVQPNRNDNGKHDTVGLPPCAVRNLQDLARIYIRRTLRNFINEEMKAKGIAQKAPPKRKRRRCRRRRINTYVFVGNQLIPQPLDSEEDERMEDDNKEEEDKDHSEALKPEEPPRNLLREKIMSLPLPESLKAYLTYYREK
ncbi:protein-L-isoaspartate O-methyltransferase domain-containing protein 1 isoform 2-T7 [Ciconia maguari]